MVYDLWIVLIRGVVFHFLDSIFWNITILQFDDLKFIIFCFIAYVFNSYLRKHCLILDQEDFTVTFSCKSIIVLTLIFRSLIHFELVFEKNVGYVSRFDILCVGIQLFQLDSLWWKDCPCSIAFFCVYWYDHVV